ncbi:type IA DNA topoisomerase [Salibacterium halotolerans]|nr:type IA DNA topoisomerase [Salibacterium halotolerans]
MMPVILAEKPSQAKAYAAAFPKGQKKEGYMTIPACSVFPEGAVLTWGVGHLIELKSPAEYEASWKRWNLQQLPMLPGTYEFRPSRKTKKQFQIVRRLLKQADFIIVATDCDREGENIAQSIIHEAGVSDKPQRRLWINSLEKEEVRKGFERLQDGEAFHPLYQEAQARQISDWVVGMNASRLYTLLLQKKGLQHVFSVGRVQTPTLKLIYDRQKEIEQFVPEPYFEIKAKFQTQTGAYEGKLKETCSSREAAADLLHRHGIQDSETGRIRAVEVKEKREKPPMLHSLSSLQTLANKKYKYSPSRTLEIVQSLYDEPLKLVTYPRTDTRHITNSEYSYVKQNISGWQRVTGDDFETQEPRALKRYVDDSKVKEHHAIIPTKKVPSEAVLQKLTREQKNLYEEIIKSVLAVFHRDYVYEETTVTTDVKGLAFFSKGKIEKQRGWKTLFDTAGSFSKQQLPELPPLKQGMEAGAHVQIHEEMTKPPKPYTEGNLINMMKTCGRLVEEDEEAKAALQEVEGLGTEATRSGIIKTLIRQEYIQVEKNIVHVTKKGEVLCEAVQGSLLSKPEMTAKWELFLRRIGEGEADRQTFIDNTSAFTTKLVSTAAQEVENMEIPKEGLPAPKKGKGGAKRQQNAPIAECPSCGKGSIVLRKTFYGCTEYSNGCRQTFNRTILGKTITKAHIRALCEKGRTPLIKGFQGKRNFDASLVMVNGKTEFSFPSTSTEKQ